MRKAATKKKRAPVRTQKRNNKNVISNSEFDWFLEGEEIESVNAMGDDLMVHFLSAGIGVQPVKIPYTLTNMLLHLGKKCFVLTHRSWIANLEHVRQYHRQSNHTLIMKSGAVLPVSRDRQEYVYKTLMEYHSRKRP